MRFLLGWVGRLAQRVEAQREVEWISDFLPVETRLYKPTGFVYKL